MGNTPTTEAQRDFYLDLSALDGLTSRAAAEFRQATRRFAKAHGVALLKTVLAELNTENTTPVAPSNSVAPSITGTKTVGQTLTGVDGTWATGYPTSVVTARQWYRSNGSGGWDAIAGATGQTYVLVSGDLAKTIKFGVSKTNDAGTTEVLSAATTTVS